MKRSIFWDFFPAPKYLAMPAAGFDISDRSLKYAELCRKKGVLTVSRFGTVIIPEGIIESGVIRQKAKLIDSLSAVQKKLKISYVGAALPEEKAFLSRVKLPIMKEEEIRGALELQLEEHIPLSANNTVFDFELIEKAKGDGKTEGHLDVNLIAFPKTLVEDYRNAFVSAGLTPLFFEMEAWALARVVAPKQETQTQLIVDFGKTRTTLVIVNSNKIQFTSTINISGDDLIAALMKNLKADVLRAEKMKNEGGLVRSKENEQIFETLVPAVSALKDEISKYIAYWNSHLEKHAVRRGKVAKILLCGGDSNLIGFPEYLSYQLKLPVELSNPWVNIVSFEKHVPEIELREALIYSTALGLSLRDMDHID